MGASATFDREGGNFVVMNTATIDTPEDLASFRIPGIVNTDVKFSRADNGTARIERLAAFRSGEHTDSLGRTREWTFADLKAMVRHYKRMKKDGSLVNIPMRVDHSWSADNVIGWISDVYADEETEMLYVDVDITEPEAASKYERGTYRERSSEIATWFDASGKEMSPSFVGLAFVDIGAVTGLYRRGAGDNTTPQGEDTSMEITEEDLKAEFAKGHAKGTEEGFEDGVKSVQPQPAHRFSIGGAKESNPEAVQAYITKLEEDAEEVKMVERDAFCASLVERGVILAPKLDEAKATARGMSAESYAAWSGLYADAAPHAAFGAPGVAKPQPGNESDDNSNGPSRKDDLEAIVAGFRAANMTDEQIAKTDTARELAALNSKGA